LTAFSVAGAQQPATLETGHTQIQTARFWRSSGTLVDGLISYSVRGSGRAVADVEIRVVDASGTELFRQAAADTTDLTAVAGIGRAVQLTMPVQLVLAPGNYTLSALVQVGSQRDSARTEITAFSVPPLVSDVIVSSSVRVLGTSDTPTGAEVRKGSYAIARQPEVAVDVIGGQVGYYTELYPQPQGDSATLELTIASKEGRTLVRSARKVAISAEGRIDAGNISTAGLPPGDYNLVVVAKAGTQEDRRTATFSVAQPMAAAPPVPAGPTSATIDRVLARYFAPEVRSDSMIAQLVEALSLAPPRRGFPAAASSFTAEAQRHALARYWEQLDPVPGTETNEMLDEYLKRLEHVSINFKERERAGIRTPRGRIYMKYGPPDVSQLMPQGRRMVEVWKYSQQRGLKFVFLDETGFGHFTLVMTNDPNEQGLPDWEGRIGDPDVVRAVVAF
jgi:GWxTD domain-containing protein